MWEEGVAQGVSKCIILNLKCAGREGGQQNWIVVVGTPKKVQCTFENGIALNNLLRFPVLQSGAWCYYCDVILWFQIP